MRATRILAFARTSRWAMVAVGTRKARAISSVESPPSVRRVSATCASGARAGWQHVKMSRSLSSGTGASSSVVSSMCRAISSCICARRARRRMRSMALGRAVETSQAAGFAGLPVAGHCSTATAYASCSASSATSKSPSRRMRVARMRPWSARNVSSMRMVALGAQATPPSKHAHLDLLRRPGPHRPHLDGVPGPQQRMAADDGEGLVEVLHVHDAVAAELLLRLHEGAVRSYHAALHQPYGSRGAAGLERTAGLVDAARPQLVAVSDRFLVGLDALLRAESPPALLVRAHQQHVAHARDPFAGGPERMISGRGSPLGPPPEHAEARGT